MTTQSTSNVVVFDLDDTLYKEVSFVESGFMAVARHVGDVTVAHELTSWWKDGKNALENLINKHTLQYSIDELLDVYRNHQPEIKLDTATASVLDYITAKGAIAGIITDGRSRTQQNKIEALGLTRWISADNILVSEEFGSAKPDIRNYRFFMSKYPDCTYTYIGDNIGKDFISANSLGWRTICIKDNGQNIHSQNFNMGEKFLPDITITDILKIKDLI